MAFIINNKKLRVLNKTHKIEPTNKEKEEKKNQKRTVAKVGPERRRSDWMRVYE